MAYAQLDATAPNVDMTAIAMARETLDAAINLSLRVQQIVDRIVGSVPTPATQTGLKEVSQSAILPDLHDFARRSHNTIQEAQAALSRLENAL